MLLQCLFMNTFAISHKDVETKNVRWNPPPARCMRKNKKAPRVILWLKHHLPPLAIWTALFVTNQNVKKNIGKTDQFVKKCHFWTSSIAFPHPSTEHNHIRASTPGLWVPVFSNCDLEQPSYVKYIVNRENPLDCDGQYMPSQKNKNPTKNPGCCMRRNKYCFRLALLFMWRSWRTPCTQQ